jgi:selenocysteine-specific elongation factor
LARAEGGSGQAEALPLLTRRQEAIAASPRADAMVAGLVPRTPRAWALELAVGEEELLPLLAHLVRDGSLCRAPGDRFFDRVAVDELRERLVSLLRARGELDAAEWEALVGPGHRHAAPLLDLFDEEGLTAARGAHRVPGPAFPAEG